MPDQRGAQFKNPPLAQVEEAIIAFGDITGTLADALDVTEASLKRYNHLMVYNNTDADIVLGFTDSGKTVTISTTYKGIIMDDILIQTKIQIKWKGSAGTTGDVQLAVW